MKKKLSLALFVILVLLALLAFAGCEDRYNFGDDYVEVASLRISSANVYLSPTGDTRNYQLEVEILPTNATNRLLRYEVPTKYADYLTVSDAGLLTARKVTPEGVSIPVKVTSTTNKKAYLTVNVVVENATVKSFSFDPDTIHLGYGDSGYQLDPIFEPRHAQDGRQLTYESNNESVCTVSSSGYVTPVGSGIATITATSTSLAGTSVKGRVRVEVHYAAGQYRLSVSDAAPQYNQIIGEYKPIKFNLEVLNEKSNPNIKIYWYVDDARVPEADGQMQYEHTPSGGTTTTYTVRVEVRAQNEANWTAESHPITLYYPFDGFSLTVGNYSDLREGYMYGDEATFEVTEGNNNIKKYLWYLRRRGETGIGTYLTENASTIKTLVRKLNLEGDFVITAVGKDKDDVTLLTREYEFSATKFVEGDVLLLDPVQRNGGVPPESYNFYRYECDENGVVDESTKKYIGSVGEGQRFRYPLNEAGTYKIFAEAILNGVVAQVGGQNFGCYTDVVKVYGVGQTLIPGPEDILTGDKIYDRYRSTGNTDVENVDIEGVTVDEENRVLVRWTPVGGVCAYLVEIIKSDGSIVMMDSDGRDVAAFGNNYVVIPTDYATLDDSFTIRIKHKGGEFTPRYYYNAEGPAKYRFEKVAADKRDYLAPVNGVINRYIVSMRELGELLNYVVLNKPDNNKFIKYQQKTVDEVPYKTYAFDFYPAFNLENSDDYYYVDVEPGEVAENLVEVYKAVMGAQKAFCPSGSYRFDFVANDNGSYSLTVYLVSKDNSVLQTDAIEHTSANSAHYSATPYGNDYDNYAIDIRKKIRVADSEQLFHAVSDGYGVTFANDYVRTLYEKAKGVVSRIIGPEMTDYEKALAFYDYLATTVAYDSALAAMSVAETPDPDLDRYAGFKLEGVFNYHQAVCDGISKAYVLLCAIEGIECVRVVGTVDGKNHAWNKINLGGVWMVVDATNGSIKEGGKLYADHAYFAVSNDEYLDLFPSVDEYGEYPVSDEGKSYYDNAGINGLAPYVTSQDELDAIINSFDRAAGVEIEVRFDVHFAYGSEEITAKIAAINNVSPNNISANVIMIGSERAIITLE